MISKPGLTRRDFSKMTGTGLAGASLPKVAGCGGGDATSATQLNTQTGLNWGQLTAVGTVVVLPMMIVGLAVRRYLVRGPTLGAVTGE